MVDARDSCGSWPATGREAPKNPGSRLTHGRACRRRYDGVVATRTRNPKRSSKRDPFVFRVEDLSPVGQLFHQASEAGRRKGVKQLSAAEIRRLIERERTGS